MYRYPSAAKGWEDGLLSFTAAQRLRSGNYVGSRGMAGNGELVLDVCKLCEVLVVHGERDKVVPAQNSIKLKDFVEKNGASLKLTVLEGLGHVAHEEDAAKFTSLLEDLVKG